MPDPRFRVPPEGYFIWTKKLGQRHYAKAGFDAETLCGMPMLGNNYANKIPISDQTECQKCAAVLSSSCPRCGTVVAPNRSCPKCGTFIPEKMWYDPNILPGKSYSYAELQFRIKTCQDVDTLKKVYSKLDNTSTEFTEFDKEMLKEEIAQRMQVILEHEEAHKSGAGEKFAEAPAEYIREQKSLENFNVPTKIEPKDKNKTPLELAREERLKQYPTEESFRTAKTKYADFLESDFHLKSYKDKAEQYKPGSIQYNKHMAVYKERLEEIANLRKEAAAGKTLIELRYEEADRQNKEYETEIEAHQQKLAALRSESYESLLAKAKSFNAIWGDDSKAWKDRYRAKDEVKDIISVLKERNIDIISALNEQLHEMQRKNKIKESGSDYELSDEEYNRVKKLSFDELINHNICPECMHRMVNGKCLLHGTRDQILSYYSKYTIKESDDEIIQQIKKEQGTLEGLKCTIIKSFHKPGYTVVVMRSYQEGESIGSKSLYDINFKQESSAKRLETKLKVLFSSGSAEESNTMYDINTTSYNIEDLEDIKKIKLAALSGVKKIWIVNKGREGLILAAKYGKEWWEKANEEDIERITVYESGSEYSVAEKARKIQMQGYAQRLDENQELSIVETNLINVGYDLRNDGRGHMVLPNGKGVSPTNHRGIVNHWEVIVDAGYLPSSNIFKLKHSPDMIVAGAINKGWRRWAGEASYEIRDLSKPNADFINKRLKQHFDNSGHDAHIDVWSEGKYYNFDKATWDKSNRDILQVIKKITPRSYQPAKAMDLKLMENEYIIRDPASIGDPDVWVSSKGAAFIDDIRGAHHGQVDGTLIAYDIKTSITIGYIDYSIYEGKLYLNSIEVESSHRRQGYATALLLKLKKLNPGMSVKWGMMTELGCALKSAVDKESPDNPSGVKVYYKGVLGETPEEYRKRSDVLDKMWGADDATLDRLEKDIEQNPQFYAKVKKLNREAGYVSESGQIGERREYTKAERIALAKAIASTVEKTTSETEGEMCIDLGNLSKLSKEERIRLAKKIAGGETEVRSTVVHAQDDPLKDEKEDCTDWLFSDYEFMLAGVESYEYLERMMDCVTSSTKLTELQKQMLRELIQQRMG